MRERYQQRYRPRCWWTSSRTPTARSTSWCNTWRASTRSIFVVGDEDQSIYSWRGADFRNVLRFRADFAEAAGLAAGAELSLHADYPGCGPERHRAQPASHRQDAVDREAAGAPIRLFEAYDEREEAEYVVAEMQRLVARARPRAGDCAVMFRTNAQSRALEDAFMQPRHLVRAGGLGALLPAARDQGRARLPAADPQPGRRGQPAAHHQCARAQDRRPDRGAAGCAWARPRGSRWGGRCCGWPIFRCNAARPKSCLCLPERRAALQPFARLLGGLVAASAELSLLPNCSKAAQRQQLSCPLARRHRGGRGAHRQRARALLPPSSATARCRPRPRCGAFWRRWRWSRTWTRLDGKATP